MGKRIFVFNEICSGCTSCEMWCSFIHEKAFNRSYSLIRIAKDAEGAFDMPIVDCDGQRCPKNEKGEPICVEMCPTGALIYTELEDAYSKRMELHEKSRVQSVFKLIAPWKYPYPWREWPTKSGV